MPTLSVSAIISLISKVLAGGKLLYMEIIVERSTLWTHNDFHINFLPANTVDKGEIIAETLRDTASLACMSKVLWCLHN